MTGRAGPTRPLDQITKGQRMPRTRQLHDPSTGKTWNTRCDGAVVEIVSGGQGRERRTTKAMDSPEAALAYARKQECQGTSSSPTSLTEPSCSGRLSPRSCTAATQLGVLTDASCASLYAVEPLR
jgi:hypothetical protein